LELKNNLIKQVMKIMKMLHKKDIVHRDFHPGNLLIKKNKENKYLLKLTDFGLSKKIGKLNEKLSKKKFKNLLCRFKPPELFGKKKIYNKKSDIYSMGKKHFFKFLIL
jgi:serine/threonine protein kinase